MYLFDYCQHSLKITFFREIFWIAYVILFRLGSVGQDTQLCLWEVSEDAIRQGLRASSVRSSMHCPSCLNSAAATATATASATASATAVNATANAADGGTASTTESTRASPALVATTPVANHRESGGFSLTARIASFALGSSKSSAPTSDSAAGAASAPAGNGSSKEHRRNFSLGSNKSNHVKPVSNHSSSTLPTRTSSTSSNLQQQQQQQHQQQQQPQSLEAK